MAEKDKVAAALLRGESYDPFGVAEMFEPAAAAEAISAVVGAPSVSASSGLEMQPGVELDTKDVKMEEVKMDEGGLQTKSDLPSPKYPLSLIGNWRTPYLTRLLSLLGTC